MKLVFDFRSPAMSILADENCPRRLPHGPIYPLTLVLMLGLNNLLYVTVTSYEPYVDCDSTPSTVLSEESRQYVLSTMPAGQNSIMFGTNTFAREIDHLPKVYEYG